MFADNSDVISFKKNTKSITDTGYFIKDYINSKYNSSLTTINIKVK